MFMAIQRAPSLSKEIAIVTHANFDKPQQHDNDYWNYVLEISQDRNLAISWNGNQHNLHFLIEGNLKFNSIGLAQGKGYPAVSKARIKELFRPTFYELELILSRFSNRENICLIGTPAPKKSNFMKNYLHKEPYFLELGEKLGFSGKNLKISSEPLRSFMWEITQELTKKSAEKLGCSFLPTPSQTFDKNKIMLEKFYSDDLTHANPAYGAFFLERLLIFYGISHELASI